MNNLKSWPSLRNDEEAEKFIENEDLSEYDWSKAEPVIYQFEDD